MKTMGVIENAFQQVLNGQRKGECLTALTRGMQEAMRAVKEHGKKATITLKLDIVPMTADGGTVSVFDDVTVRLPKPKPQASVFYSTDDNRLVRNDPNQKEMTLQEVEKPEPVDIQIGKPTPRAVNA